MSSTCAIGRLLCLQISTTHRLATAEQHQAIITAIFNQLWWQHLERSRNIKESIFSVFGGLHHSSLKARSLLFAFRASMTPRFNRFIDTSLHGIIELNCCTIIIMNSSRLLLISRQSRRRLLLFRSPAPPRSRIVARPSSSNSSSVVARAATSSSWSTAAAILLATTATLLYGNNSNNEAASLLSASCSAPPKLLGAEPTMLSPATEPKTGILFPRLCNGMTLAGCGVRVKYGFVKVSALNVYILYIYNMYIICI